MSTEQPQPKPDTKLTPIESRMNPEGFEFTPAEDKKATATK